MILTCPSCSTRYVVPLSALPPEGRSMRCGKCHHMWMVHQEEEPVSSFQKAMSEAQAEAEDQIEFQEAPQFKSVNRAPIKYTLPPKARAALAALLLWAVIAAGFYVYWGKEWYQTIAPYEVSSAAIERLVFDRVIAHVDEANGKDRLTIEGQIINLSSATITLPDVAVSLVLKDGSILDLGTIAIEAPHVAGESAEFFEESFELKDSEALDKAAQISLTFLSAPETVKN